MTRATKEGGLRTLLMLTFGHGWPDVLAWAVQLLLVLLAFAVLFQVLHLE